MTGVIRVSSVKFYTVCLDKNVKRANMWKQKVNSKEKVKVL